MLVLCVVALSIGAQYPTQMIVACTYPTQRFYDSHAITVFDMNRNLPIHILAPDKFNYDGGEPFIRFSPNGRRGIVSYGFQNSIMGAMIILIAWDIFSGETAYIQNSDCMTMNLPEWTADNRQVFFTCFTGGEFSNGQFFDFDTRQLTSVPIMNGFPSPDGRYFVNQSNSELIVLDTHEVKEYAINPPNVWGRFIAWETDSESLLFRGIDSIQRYTLATQSTEILVEDVSIFQDMMLLSPDGQWLGMVTGLRQPLVQALHLPTATLYDVSVVDDKTILADWINWSPDSQWLFIGGHDETNTIHYVTKPDASMMQILIETPTQVQTGSTLLSLTLPQPEWLSGSEWLTYLTVYDNYLYIWRWDEGEGRYNLVKRIVNGREQTIWTQNHDKLIFIQVGLNESRLVYLDMDTDEIRFISSPSEMVGDYRLVE
jgi:hypothetical protein